MCPLPMERHAAPPELRPFSLYVIYKRDAPLGLNLRPSPLHSALGYCECSRRQAAATGRETDPGPQGWLHQRPLLCGFAEDVGVGVGGDVRPINFPDASKME